MTRPMRKTTIALLALMLLVDAGPTFAAPTEPESTPEISLTDLLASRFGNLSVAERRLVAATELGVTADCADLSGDDKVIRGDLLAWLCADTGATARLTYRGISIKGAIISGAVMLDWANIAFPIQALNCDFGSPISVSGGCIRFFSLQGSSVSSLDAKYTQFKGSVLLSEGFRAKQRVDLTGSIIDGNLDCSKGEFNYPSFLALDVGGAEVKGAINLSDCTANGGVSLIKASINGSLSCENGHFVKSEEAGAWLGLNADNTKIGGSVYLRSKVSFDGQISFFAASVGGAFQLWDVQCPETGYLDLRFLKVQTLLNDSKSWPRPGNLLVDGFVYDQIDERADLNAQTQLRWLHLQPHDRFLSQPFDQLASVFRKMGLEEDACQVMIAKNEEHARYVQGQPEWCERRRENGLILPV